MMWRQEEEEHGCDLGSCPHLIPDYFARVFVLADAAAAVVYLFSATHKIYSKTQLSLILWLFVLVFGSFCVEKEKSKLARYFFI